MDGRKKLTGFAEVELQPDSALSLHLFLWRKKQQHSSKKGGILIYPPARLQGRTYRGKK
jgi:hypothetical protein